MSTYIIGDNTGGKYIAAKDGEKTKDVLDVPTRLLGKGDKTGGLRLFHDLGAVYGLVDDSSGWGKEKFYMKATGSNAVLKTFEKWTGDKYDYANAWIPYTTHVERMILFSGKNGWTSDGKELKSTVKTDGMATWKFTAVELADGLVVFPLNAGYGSGDAADSSVKVMMYAVDVDDFVADSKPVEGKEEELIFEPPGGTTDDIKIVLSGNRCLFWNKRNGTVDELLFNNIKAPPSPQRMWDSKDDPVMDITGGTDGRFIISTKEAARMLTGDKLEEIKIGNEWTGGNNHQWALGDGWEIVYTYDGDIYGRGKNVANVLQNSAKELKEWTKITLTGDAAKEAAEQGIVRLWSAPKAWAFATYGE